VVGLADAFGADAFGVGVGDAAIGETVGLVELVMVEDEDGAIDI